MDRLTDWAGTPVAGASVVTIGKFDGVHRGHRVLLEHLTREARERGLSSRVLTFDRNPLELFAPERVPPAIVSPAQRAELLAAAGVDTTVELRFDRERAAQAPEDFVAEVLVGALGARLVLCGDDFRFGRGGAGDVALLRRLGAEHGFEVICETEPVLGTGVDDARRVSSSWIRELLAAGGVREAGVLLGRKHRIRSTVVGGLQRGRELGFPTANLDPALEGLLPVDSVYATWAHVPAGRFMAAVSIGNNPTFEGVPQHQVEAHLLDFAGDLYGQQIELEFVEQVRLMNAFDSVESLVAQLDADVQRIRDTLAAEA